MTTLVTPSPRRPERRPDHSAIRLPNMRWRLTPPLGFASNRGSDRRTPLGGPPLRAA